MSTRDAASDIPDEIVITLDAREAPIIDLTRDATESLTDVAGAVGRKGGALRHFRVVGFVLVLIDVLCLASALLAAHLVRFGSPPDGEYVLAMVVSVLLWVGAFQAQGLYAPQHFSWLEEFRRTVSAVGIGIVLVVLLTFWLDVYLSRSWMALTSSITASMGLARQARL